MQGIVGRVAAKMMHSLVAAVGSKVGNEAEELCACTRQGNVPLQRLH